MAETNGEENEYLGILHEEGVKILEGIKDVDLDPEGLDTLFNCDQPLKLSRQQRAVVIEGLRKAREKYLVNKKAKADRKKKAPKPTPAEIEGMSLDDLNLDLSDLV